MLSASRKTAERLRNFWKNDAGSTAIEYGLICALIFLVITTSLFALGNSTNTLYNKIGTAITTATSK